jgi:hypothetical protein
LAIGLDTPRRDNVQHELSQAMMAPVPDLALVLHGMYYMACTTCSDVNPAPALESQANWET